MALGLGLSLATQPVYKNLQPGAPVQQANELAVNAAGDTLAVSAAGDTLKVN